MSASSPRFRQMYPRAYPVRVYRCTFPWAGAIDCFVRKVDRWWETARIPPSGLVRDAAFGAVAGARRTRHAAVMAFDYYHNRLRGPDGPR